MPRSESEQSIGLVLASKKLGVDLFEFAGILAAERRQLDRGRIPLSELHNLRIKYQIESWWPEGSPGSWRSTEDAVRGVLGALLGRGCVEPRQTRRDNLWRGLPRDLVEPIREAVEVLLDEGLLSAAGRRDISVASSGVGVVHLIASGMISPPSLMEIWGEHTHG
jgi:hypothetical protein